MKTQLITGPSVFPITTAEAKTHLRVSHTNDDAYIAGLIRTATNWIETYLTRRIVTQTHKAFYDDFPNGDSIILPFGQLQSVTHIKYTNSAGTQTTMTVTTDYLVESATEPGRIVLAYGKTWPSVTLYPSNPIEIQFVSGYYHGAAWVASTAYSENDVMVPTTYSGFAYTCSTAGTSDSSEATWGKTIDGTTADNTAVWTAKPGIPEDIRHAVMLMVSDLYESRETEVYNLTYRKINTIENLLFHLKMHERPTQ